MRILRIAGENLASLAGAFDVRLDEGPLRGTGLFAITGPTGSGKSTILDALCLALYDKLPRLGGADRQVALADPSGQAIAYDDVRGILRRGAVLGHAEVDFVGRDGGRFRARWEVKRARGRADGRLQDERLSLVALDDGQPLGGTKTETLAAIEARVGLGFEQFRRAALLAQGDFDTFIRADAKDRAELLERITGTAIYGEISRRIHVKHRDRARDLAELTAALGETAPLDADARGRLETERAELERESARIADQGETLLVEGRWYETEGALARTRAEAEAALEAAERAVAASTAERARLELRRRALEVRAERETCVHAVARERATEAERSEKLGAAARAAMDGDGAAERAQAAAKKRDEARAARASLEPQLREARALDRRSEDAAARWASMRQASMDARGQRDARLGEHGSAEDALAAAEGGIRELEAWLGENGAAAKLAARREELARALAELAAVAGTLGSLKARAEAAALDAEAAERARHGAETEERSLRRQLEENAREREPVEAVLAAYDDAELERRRRALEDAGQLTERARAARDERARARDELAGIEALRRERTHALHECEAALAEASLLRPRLEGGLHEARRALEVSNAAADAHTETLREGLVAGEPCPVCGATEHPFAGALAATRSAAHARVEIDRRRVADLEGELSATTKTEAEAKAHGAAHGKALEELDLRAARQEAARRTAGERLSQLGAALAPLAAILALPPAGDLGGEGALEDLERRLVERRTRNEFERDERARLEQQLAQHDGKATELRRSLDGALDRQRTAADTLTHARVSAEKLAGERAALERERASRDEQLDDLVGAAWPDWRARAAADAEGFARTLDALAKAWSEKSAALDALRTRAHGLRGERARTEARLADAQIVLARAEGAATEAEATLASLREARAAFFDGRATEVVEAEVQAEVGALERSADEADAASRRADALRVAAEASLAAAETALATARREALEADALFARALADRGLSREATELALALDPAAVLASAARLEALDAAHQEARTTLDERRRVAAEHALGRPARAPAELAQGKADLTARQEAQRARHGEVLAQLGADDERRARGLALEGRRVELAPQVARLGELKDVLGAADGAKFRDYAQSLTLVELLRLSNHHLRDLAPRYTIRRVGGSKLSLEVVDHDMGDEVRPVHSLSGGERFLASLALSLGLAGLSSAEGTHVASLFIDEGFGALDGHSLDVALAALESLQATGRQIGIISHVSELKERIAVRVEVEPQGGGRSVVRVLSS